MRPSMRVLGVVAVLALVAVACGDDSGGGEAGGTTTASTADTADTTAPAPPIGPEVAGIDLSVMDLPPGDPYEDYVMVQDHSGVIELEVPEDWSYLVTESYFFPYPFVEARTEEWGPPDMSGVAVYPPPGVTVEGFGGDRPEQWLSQLASNNNRLEEDCEAMEAIDYADGTYTDLAEIWTGCGPDQAGELLIITSMAGGIAFVDMRLLTDADIDAATRIVESLSYKPTRSGGAA